MSFGTRRTGLPTMRVTARYLCKLVNQFTPVIKALYPDNELLLAALVTANVACATLVEQIDEALPQGV